MEKRFLLLIASAALILSGCNLFNALAGQPIAAEASPTPETGNPPPGTPFTLAPTLEQGPVLGTPTPTSEGGSAPTPLPEPTQILPATPASEGGEAPAGGGETTPVVPTPAASGPGISLSPAVGEPGDVVIVTGSGFEPNTTVTLHWGAPDGPPGPVYWEVETDENGEFSVGLIVPPAEQWPRNPPQERDLFQLRAYSESLGDFYYWANFTYLERFNPVTSLVLTYTSEDYGYSIDVPNGWTWDWEEDATDNVRFAAPSGTAKGFIRVIETSDVNAAIQSVMAAEAPGQSYTTTQATLGAYPGTEVTAGNGLVVWFIPQGGRVYAISFTDDNGQFYTLIASSFRLG